MTPLLSRKQFESRVLHYAQTTGIHFVESGKYAEWKSLGLPDLRGFTPHLREVRLYKNQRPDSWIIHDLLHILFYDFATHYLGRGLWKDSERFREVHLASEAFAVLSYDYHVLSFYKDQGLAVDCDFDLWPRYLKLNPRLPHLLSQSFCDALVELYLSGQDQIFKIPAKKATKDYINWIGHEIRYAEKQRIYVEMWLQDLMGLKGTTQLPVIEGSAASGPLWELLKLLFSPEKTWKSYVNRVAKSVRKNDNYFASLKKYKQNASRKLIDFRFTDFRSLSPSNVQRQLQNAVKPSGENLFLMWQILGLKTPADLQAPERRAIKSLASTAQTKSIDQKAWDKTRELCLVQLTQVKYTLFPRGKSMFYLP